MKRFIALVVLCLLMLPNVALAGNHEVCPEKGKVESSVDGDLDSIVLDAGVVVCIKGSTTRVTVTANGESTLFELLGIGKNVSHYTIISVPPTTTIPDDEDTTTTTVERETTTTNVEENTTTTVEDEETTTTVTGETSTTKVGEEKADGIAERVNEVRYICEDGEIVETTLDNPNGVNAFDVLGLECEVEERTIAVLPFTGISDYLGLIALGLLLAGLATLGLVRNRE